MLKKINYITVFFIMVLFSFFLSCKTVSQLSDATVLYGLIIDENNQPVKNASISYINDSGAKTVYSNERGVFQFEDIHYGRYDFVVEKTGYEIKNVDNLNFFDRRRIICFQLTSKISFFNKIDALFKNNQFEKAILKIESMNTNGDMNLYNLCSLYKSFGYFKLNNISKARKELDEVKKHNCCFSYSILEEKLEGK